MKKNPHCFPIVNGGRAVPLGFNLLQNRYPLPISCRSDCTKVQVWFYEYHGLYWYSVTVGGQSTFNSVGFLSVQNCVSEFRSFLRGYGFVLEDSYLAECRLRGLRSMSEPPKSWKV